MRWKTGRLIEVSARWHTASLVGVVELTTGSPYCQASIVDQVTGGRLYDQGGGIFGPAQVTFPLTYVAGVGWRLLGEYPVPAAAASRELTIECIHPLHPEVIKDIGWVVVNDLDDIDAQLASVNILGGDVEQDAFQPVPP